MTACVLLLVAIGAYCCFGAGGVSCFEVKCIVLKYFDFISIAVFLRFSSVYAVFLSTAVCFCSEILIDCRRTVANTGYVVFST
jgi:hypothetical protein